MSLFDRLHTLFLANAHHAVDLAEDPERMVKQIIRELDAEVRAARAAVVRAIAAEKQLAAELARHRNNSHDLARKAESAVATGHTDLAKTLLTRKVEQDRLAAELERSWACAQNTSSNLKTQLEALLNKRAEVCQQRQALAARQRAAHARKSVCRALDSVEALDTADERFGRMRDRVSELEAESLAVCEVMQTHTTAEADADDLAAAAQVELELRAIEAKLGTQARDDDDQRPTL